MEAFGDEEMDEQQQTEQAGSWRRRNWRDAGRAALAMAASMFLNGVALLKIGTFSFSAIGYATGMAGVCGDLLFGVERRWSRYFGVLESGLDEMTNGEERALVTVSLSGGLLCVSSAATEQAPTD